MSSTVASTAGAASCGLMCATSVIDGTTLRRDAPCFPALRTEFLIIGEGALVISITGLADTSTLTGTSRAGYFYGLSVLSASHILFLTSCVTRLSSRFPIFAASSTSFDTSHETP